MKKIFLWDLSTVGTYTDIVQVYSWCNDTFGPPYSRWAYGRDMPEMFAGSVISNVEEIQFIEIFDDEDAVLFRLRFGA